VLTVVALIVVVALVFDFINGFHDAANSIATVVSMGPVAHAGLAWAAFFSFVAAFSFGVSVAPSEKVSSSPASSTRRSSLPR
jgi:PiT family inorganic phosphate transporter